MSKKFGFKVERIRIDLDGVFTEGELPSAHLFESFNKSSVLHKIKKYIKNNSNCSEIVEQEGDYIQFDTRDLTVSGTIEEIQYRRKVCQQK